MVNRTQRNQKVSRKLIKKNTYICWKKRNNTNLYDLVCETPCIEFITKISVIRGPQTFVSCRPRVTFFRFQWILNIAFLKIDQLQMGFD